MILSKDLYLNKSLYDKKPAECYKWNSNGYSFHIFFSVFQFETTCNNVLNVLQCIIAQQKYEEKNPQIHFIQSL